MPAAARRSSVSRSVGGEVAPEGEPTFSWKDVAEHNTAKSAWVIYKGGVYDVTEWLPRHPGGDEVLLLSAGRDVTDMVGSYHPFSMEKAEKTLTSYRVGRVVDSEFPTYKEDTGFYRALRERVGAYFDETGKDPRDPWPGMWRNTLSIVGFVAAFLVMADLYNPMSQGWTTVATVRLPALWAAMSQGDVSAAWAVATAPGEAVTPLWVRCVAAVALGLFQAFPLLHGMHDSCHCAMGPNQLWWQVWGRGTMELVAGASIFAWQHQHVVGHHLYTNVYAADPDLPHAEGDPRYLVFRQAWGAVYKWQHIYMPILYGLLAIKMRLDDIIFVWLQEKDGPIRVNWFESPLIRVVAVKALWLSWRVALPLALGTTALQVAALFLLAEATTGYWLAFNFQVSHITTGCEFPLDKDEPSVDPDTGLPSVGAEWGRQQAASSINWKGGPIQDFLCGALNYQIEHHLFPGISQYHYPALAPIVERTCAEFDVPYQSYSGFWPAFAAHIDYLKQKGAKGEAVALHLD